MSTAAPLASASSAPASSTACTWGNARAQGCDPLGVADSNRSAQATAAQGRHGILAAYDDYRELLADCRIQAVIATPNALHVEHAVAALAAGKHVFLEKPMATDAEGCRRIIAARDRAGLVVQQGHGQPLQGRAAGGGAATSSPRAVAASASARPRALVPGSAGGAASRASAAGPRSGAWPEEGP